MLKVHRHINATYFPANASLTCEPGQPLGLNSSGEAVLADHDASNAYLFIGLAGDKKGTFSANSFVNRIQDVGDDSSGSGKITVYNEGGEFYLDYGSSADAISDTSLAVGDTLYISATAGKLTKSDPGSGTAACKVLDILTSNSGYLDSGIPNMNVPVTDSDNPRKFVLVKLIGA